jgi:cyclopropane-fatty-acyl-phospholipid synthase
MLRDRITAALEALQFECPFLITFPDGSKVIHGIGPPAFSIHFRTRQALRRCIATPSLGFGEGYVRGEVQVEGDLQQVALLGFALKNGTLKGSLFERLRYALGLRRRRNTLVGARRNIEAHYDLGNEFYSLWLDRELQYTCAYFLYPTVTLEDAQREKMEVVCRKLRLQAGETVIDAGCGWGSLALHMATNHDVRVIAFNISREQIEFARVRQKYLGISADRVNFILDDYQNMPRHVQKCDKFASVGMLEHVDRRSYRSFHELVQRILKPQGLALIQFISRTARSLSGDPWLEKHVFPGYYNPSLAEIVESVESTSHGLHVVDVENLRHHYALTVQHWIDRFERNVETIRARYGEELVRTFRLYLNGGYADFANGRGTLVFQVLLSNGFDNSAPLARMHHYLHPSSRPAEDAIALFSEREPAHT